MIAPGAVVSVRDLPEAGPPSPVERATPRNAPDLETLSLTKRSFAQSHGGPPPGPTTLATGSATTVTPAPGALVGLRRSESGGWIPPDTQVGVSANHIFEVVNLEGRIWTKAGALLKTFDLVSFFGLTGSNLSDPKIRFDVTSGRWFVAIISYNKPFTAGAWNLAVSKTSDPTGAFSLYTVSTSNSAPDFPALAVNDDKVVLTANAYHANSFTGTEFVVLNKAQTVAGVSATTTFFAPPQGLFTIQPGHPLTACALSGCPLYMASVAFNSASSLQVWMLTGVPGVGAGVSVATTSVAISSLTSPPGAQQLGTSSLIETNDNRLLEATYRGDATGGALWVSANSACVPSGDTATRACLRFIKLAISAGGAVTKPQDFDFGQSGFYYYYPAIQTDGAGNLIAVFSGSSSSTYAGVYASGQQTTDPANSFQSPPTLLKNGENSYTPSSQRWGDYSGAALDPASPSTVWVAGEYAYISGGAEWGTYIAPVQIGTSTTTADLQMVSKTGSPSTVVAGNDVTYTLVAKNNGPNAASTVVVTDPLPAGMTFKATGSSPSCSGSTTVTCSVGTLNNGASTTLTVVATVAANATPGSVTNTATVSGSTTDTNSGNNSANTITTIVAPTVGITGTVTTGGSPLSGVSFSGALGGSCGNSNASGVYSCTVPQGFTGTITPSLSGYTFTPASRSYSNLVSNQAAQDYTATPVTFTITGTVTVSGSPLSGVSFSGATGGSCGNSNASGVYSCTVPYNFTGTITPALSGYTFTPASRSYTNVLTNQTAQNYTATAVTFTIGGTVTASGSPLSGVSFSGATGGSCGNSNASGVYSCTVPYNFTGTITPALTNYTFTPASRSYTNVLVNQTAQDYTATASTSTPINVAAQANGGVASASSTYSSAYPASAVNDGDRKGLNPGNGGYWNDATAGVFPDWVQITFNSVKTITEVDVFSLQDNYASPSDPTPQMTFTLYGLADFQVQYWTGSAWATVPNGAITNNNAVWRQITFPALATDRIRVSITRPLDQWSRVVEIEAWGTNGGSLPPPTTVNVAAQANGGVASASSTYSNAYPVSAVNDGDRSGLNPGNGGYWNDATPGVFPDSVQILFNGTKTITEIDIFSLQDNYTAPTDPTPAMTFSLYGLADFQVQYWTGSAWATVPGGNITNNDLVWRQITFAAIATDRIQVVITRPLDQWSRVVEIEAWTAP